MRRGPRISIVLAALATAGLALAALLSPTRRPEPDERMVSKMHLFQVRAASTAYNATYGMWPTGLAQLFAEHNDRHIDFLPPDHQATNDGWGHPILYRPFDAALGYGAAVSLGRDAKPGGGGKNTDLEERFH